jgi:DNA gyrase/topoisomerase IV subunit A
MVKDQGSQMVKKLKKAGKKLPAAKVVQTEDVSPNNGNTVSIGDLGEKNMMEYGAYTIYSRAISMLYDGMKPVHRRSIYAMFKMGLFNNVAHQKAAKVYGNVIGNYHPHGDLAVYGAMVGIATGAGTPTALIDGQGNWGNYDGAGPTKGAAAGRYTECKMTKYATDQLVSRPYMDEEVIPYVPNYDGSTTEPLYLPSLLPTLFLLGTEGIAVGVSVNMPAYTYTSVLEATKVLFKTRSGEKASKKLVPTQRWGSVLLSDQKDIDAYHKTGNGKLVWGAPYEVKREKNATIVRMTGLPPVAYETLHGQIMGTEGGPNKKPKPGIKGVYSMVDLTNEDGLLFEITIKDESAGLAPVKKKLVVSESYRSATTVLVPSKNPEEPLRVAFEPWSPNTILEKWLEWRIELEKRLIKSLLRDNEEEIRRLNLTVLAASKLDMIVEILKTKGGDKVALIEKRLKVTNAEAKEIWQMPLRQLDRLNAEETKAKIKTLEATNKSLKADYKVPAERILRYIETLPVENPNGKLKIDKAKKRKVK